MRVAFGQAEPILVVQVEGSVPADAVAALFPSDLAPPGEGAAALRAREGDMGFELIRPGPPRRVEVFGSFPDLLVALERTICHALLAQAPDAAQLHAAGAVVNGRAVLALGPSGAGKSSLALEWSMAGHALLGDDVVLVERDGRVGPFRRLLKVHRERLESHGLLPADTLGFDPAADEVWFDPRRSGGWAGGPMPFGALAFVRHRPGRPTTVRRMKEPEALRYLLDSVMGSGVGPAAALDRFIAQLPDCRTMYVEFGSAADAARRLCEEARVSLAPAHASAGGDHVDR